MKGFIQRIFRLVTRIYFTLLIQFFFPIKYRKASRVLILDIDNTLADTWPTLINPSGSTFKRLQYLKAFRGMKTYVDSQTETSAYFFLSVRPIWFYITTLNWLQKHNYRASVLNLILVDEAADKLYYLSKVRAVLKSKELVYIDDLSYNHERNDLKYYQEVIQEVSKMDVTYINYQQILVINTCNAN